MIRQIARGCCLTLAVSACSPLPFSMLLPVSNKIQTPPPAQSLPEASRAISALGGTECFQQERGENAAKQLIVRITSSFPGTAADEEVGSGIVFAIKDGSIFIMTARHVVKDDVGGNRQKVVVDIGGKKSVPARKTAQFDNLALEEDIAVIQIDQAVEGLAAYAPDFAVLHDRNKPVTNLLAIGYPGGALDPKSSPPGMARIDGKQLLVSTSVEQGNSGGGIFTSDIHLVALMSTNEREGARGYPIRDVIPLFVRAGLPVDLRDAPLRSTGLYLDYVTGEPKPLIEALRDALSDILKAEGFEPGCKSPSSHTLVVHAKGWKESGSSTIVEISGRLTSPAGGSFDIWPERTTLLHAPWQNPLNDSEQIKPKAVELMKTIAQNLKSQFRVTGNSPEASK